MKVNWLKHACKKVSNKIKKGKTTITVGKVYEDSIGLRKRFRLHKVVFSICIKERRL